MAIDKAKLIEDFVRLGVKNGDVVLIRAGLGEVGRMENKANTFIDALLDVIGPEGTVVSLAFTNSYFIKKPPKDDYFHVGKKSYAGALPNTMLSYSDSYRSKHPTCSYVAIGRNAEYITSDHDYSSPAYEPIRKIIELEGKCVLVGCVESSPGFTTTHLAEQDLGMLKLNILPALNRVYFKDDKGGLKIFKRTDPGLCSSSFYKFYSYYVRSGVLSTGFVGKAYSIAAPAKEAYEIDMSILKKDRKFNVCGNPDCMTCNAKRWDRIHHLPFFLFKKILRKIYKF